MQPSIIGYCNPLRGRPGERLGFHISSSGGQPFRARVVRIICGDANPNGPGLDIRDVRSDIGGQYAGREQVVPIGSCGLAPLPPLGDYRSLSCTLNVRPTRLDHDMRALCTLQDADAGKALILGIERGELVLILRSDGHETRTAVALRLEVGQWYAIDLALTDGSAAVAVKAKPIGLRRVKEESADVALGVPVVLGAWTRAAFAAVWSERPISCFNGQIEAPAIRNGADGKLIAAWNFSERIDQQTFADVGPHECDGELVNTPTRAVRGSNWDGTEMNWRHAPQQYGAIHFHDDDLSDCKWTESVALTIPADWESGTYGLEISNDIGSDTIPFFVLPKRDAPRKAIAVLVSTFTFLAYANHARGVFDAAFRERIQDWQAYPYHPDEVKQFAASTYNDHSDGSGVSLSSRLRPILTMRPGYMTFNDPVGSGLRHFPADTHLECWMHRFGFDFDLVTDEDLDDEGVAAIAGYRVLITGSHPEYHTERTLNALLDFQYGGGNFMYLGGNGFYWRIARRADLPHVIEIRRAEGGIRAWACRPGEYYHQLDGAYGGLWRRNDRPPQTIAGLGFVVQGPYDGDAYRRTPESYRPDVAWIFDGVTNEVIGEHGLFGGGAAGFELDQVSEALGTPPGTIILARSEGHDDTFKIVPEEVLTYRRSVTPDLKVEAHMVIGGGGDRGRFFSTGSITFIGCLSHNGYDNDVSRILENVVRRFSAPAPK
jgi:N,N-dimethylformamidase